MKTSLRRCHWVPKGGGKVIIDSFAEKKKVFIREFLTPTGPPTDHHSADVRSFPPSRLLNNLTFTAAISPNWPRLDAQFMGNVQENCPEMG